MQYHRNNIYYAHGVKPFRRVLDVEDVDNAPENGGNVKGAMVKMRLIRWKMLRSCLVALAVLLAPAVAAAAMVGAIRNASVIDMDTGKIRRGQTVLWDGGRISAVGSDRKVAIPAGATVIDGKGRFLMPGLWDMHVHLAPWDEKPQDPLTEDLTLPMFIAAGVTGVRDMGDMIGVKDPDFSLLATKRAWSAEALAGARVGPRLMAAGSFPIDGPAVLEDFEVPAFYAAATPDDARHLAHHVIERRGSDFIKVYSGIPREPYFAMLDEARKMGVVVAGHKPLSVSFLEAVQAGQRSIEHAREIIIDSSTIGSELRRTSGQRNLAPADLKRALDNPDPALLQTILDAMAKRQTYYVPTHLTRRFDWLAASDAPQLRDDPRLATLNPQRRTEWQADVTGTRKRASGPNDAQIYKAFFERGLAITGQAYRSGVPIMAGTDSGDSFCFPGSGLHDELQLLVQGGLPPLAALRAATVVPARFLGRSDDYGSIAVGKTADMILLDRNPLADIRNIRGISTVIFNGMTFDEAALQRIAKKAAASARALAAKTAAAR